jgi:Carboxypeptidase regulatory-like domain
MRYPKRRTSVRILIIVAMLLVCIGGLMAQDTPIRTGTVRGQVADPSGASVANAAVKLTGPAGEILTRSTDGNGSFEINNLPPGNYSLSVSVAGFALREQPLQIAAGQIQQLAVSLEVATNQQEVTVAEVAPTVDASPANNASAVVMSGSDLEALSDDPDQLQADLEALAGSGGPEGGQIFIDGFTGGQLPPKSSIREIRINSNPFSAEYDFMGFGRIEVLTRPGTDVFHGRFSVQGNSSVFNTNSPFVTAANQVPYHSVNYEGNLSGSFRRVASFSLSAFRRNINNSAIVNAIILDPSFNPVSFNAGVGTPQTLTLLNPRIDYQVNRDNTFTARYQYTRNVRNSIGVGGFNLPEQADDAQGTAHLLQITDSQIIGERAVNETRFQYIRNENRQTAQFPGTTLRVTGAFTGGGSSSGATISTTDRYELQNYTSLIAGPHIFKFGGRLRANHLVDSSTDNFLGTFTFPSITAYQLTERGLAQNQTMDQIRANGGGPNQFTITAGSPRASVTVVDLGVYLQDDWKVRPSITLSGGLRFETQTKVPDHVDVAPRIGLAWAIGDKNRPTVIRTGFGLFYNRLGEQRLLQLERFDGLTQQEYIVSNPDCYPNCSAAALASAQTPPTVYSIASDFRSQYNIQAAFTVERQITRIANLSVNYLTYRAVHRLVRDNINAPLPGSITAANPAGVRPFGSEGNIYQYQSPSHLRQTILYTTLNIRGGARLSLFGTYLLASSHAHALGIGGFPSNSYDLQQDYGRANIDVRHAAYAGGSIALPYALRLSPFIAMQTGAPFNVTLGQDLNGDSIFNDRPAFATSQTLPQNLVATSLGNFDTAPAAGATPIPINYGRGTTRVSVNLRLGKVFTFGPAVRPTGAAGAAVSQSGGRPAGTPGRYSLTFNIDGRNIFNRVNLGNPVGNLSSPLFGTANSLAGGPYTTGAAVRRVDLQLVFAF